MGKKGRPEASMQRHQCRKKKKETRWWYVKLERCHIKRKQSTVSLIKSIQWKVKIKDVLLVLSWLAYTSKWLVNFYHDPPISNQQRWSGGKNCVQGCRKTPQLSVCRGSLVEGLQKACCFVFVLFFKSGSDSYLSQSRNQNLQPKQNKKCLTKNVGTLEWTLSFHTDSQCFQLQNIIAQVRVVKYWETWLERHVTTGAYTLSSSLFFI